MGNSIITIEELRKGLQGLAQFQRGRTENGWVLNEYFDQTLHFGKTIPSNELTTYLSKYEILGLKPSGLTKRKDVTLEIASHDEITDLLLSISIYATNITKYLIK